MKRNRLAVFGMVTIGLCVLISLLGPNITPDSTPNGSIVVSELREKPPGYTARFLLVRKNIEEDDRSWISKAWNGRQNMYDHHPIIDYRFDGNFIYVKPYMGEGVISRQEVPHDIADVVFALDENQKQEVDSSAGKFRIHEKDNTELITISREELYTRIEEDFIVDRTYWLGTDQLGRDMLTRLLLGTRVSLSVGVVSVVISLFIGILLGAISGFFRGWVDDFIMWVINVVWSIPTLLLVIAITLALGKGLGQVFIAVGLTMWVDVARVVRGQTLSLREKEFVEAGRALGFTDFRIIIRHIMPNVMGPVIVICAANFANAILIEAGLSFLGIGAQPPTASWGAMINDHRQYLFTDSSYLAIVPGLAIMILVLAFMLVGNGLRDALDAKAIDEDQVMGY
ncbi:MAG: ABC transporter permease [Bacteroidia bacterium]|nr:ABC transporter permease [Bacteroidia bacterium]